MATSNLCDVNVWLALALEHHEHQATARRWLDDVEAPKSVLFCRATQQSFLRLLTTAAVFAPFGLAPLTNRAAWAAFGAFTADDRVALRTDEPAGLDRVWNRFVVSDSASPKLWMDAYLAAFAVAAGWRLVTTDRSFQQFAELDVVVLA
jgi:toxin-antitoxin system PIN domain toxin